MIQKYFKEKIIEYEEIQGHFNKNYKVKTNSGFFHLKIFKNNNYEIKKWINGNVIKKWDKKTIIYVCQAIKKLHNKNYPWKKMDYLKLDIKDDKYNKLVKKYKNKNLVPCHNDLNKDNIIIFNSRATLIDFEFKRLNNKHWDIANIINEEKLSDNHIEFFLKNYKELEKKVLMDFIYINKIFVKKWKVKNL